MLAAVRLLANQARLVAEPGGAAAVAAWLYHRDELPECSTPVAVLSGGNIDPPLLATILASEDRLRRRRGDELCGLAWLTSLRPESSLGPLSCLVPARRDM
jgi:threonine dehydratase